ncbi:NAD-dependent epimerase/dehydratase family protein [Nocardioides litoris]|uniref:NAD-dependent epimerase/dehydratase family protein n=1 Tax=Nocardioides litoris TaxID=1926648 RepID=UPI0011204E5C|nr:NAD-dependent epimerase/dehydratase family protein [Nocardioides litoris]
MRVAVTGASGFCGGAAARLLTTQGHEVVTVGRAAGSDRPWDAATGTPDLVGCDAVVHLAATVGDGGGPQFERVNVDGARRLLAAAERAGARVVWVSSSSVYDPRPDRTRVTEDHPTEAGHLNAYGRTKAAGDRLALAAGAAVLRPRAVYGPGDPHLLPRLRRAVRFGRVSLPGPDVRLSVTHVDNLASACVAALDWRPGAYNVADRDPAHRDHLVAAATGARVRHVPVGLALLAARGLDAAARATRREPLLTPYAVDTLAHEFCLDTSRIRATGWEPRDLLQPYLTSL